MNEFEFIKNLLKPLATSPLSLSLCDDIALLRNKNLAFSTDTICENTHFLKDTDPNKISAKLLRVNISDLCAKAIFPKYYSLNLSFNQDTINKQWLESFVTGLKKTQSSFGISLLGGDTTTTKHGSVFSATIFGEIEQKYISRKGAKDGDLIFVTGSLGDSFIGLNILKNQLVTTAKNKNYFIKKYELPSPRIEIIKFLRSVASASIDISDGIIQDLNHILSSSSCGANLMLDSIPTSSFANKILNIHKISKQQLITHGDDYEILFTSPKKHFNLIKSTAKSLPFSITNIGTITNKHTGIKTPDTPSIKISSPGYTHHL